VPAEKLHAIRERHIRCNPATAQFIVDPRFAPVHCEGAFAKEHLDPEFVAQEEARLTRGWQRLQELPALGLPLTDYPLPDVREAARQAARQREIDASAAEYERRMLAWHQAAAEERPAE